MIKTIRVQQTTKQLLNRLKNKKGLKSYDALMKEILEKEMGIKDMFGYAKNRPFRFRKEDEMNTHEL